MHALAIHGFASLSPTPSTPPLVRMTTTKLSWAEEVNRGSKSGARRAWHSTSVIFSGGGLGSRGETVSIGTVPSKTGSGDRVGVSAPTRSPSRRSRSACLDFVPDCHALVEVLGRQEPGQLVAVGHATRGVGLGVSGVAVVLLSR